MQSTNRPAKFLVPFAQNDSARVEIPATTTDPARFSQSLGSPPLTGMPPEAGGVPPQLEDFNGAINQIARGVWWSLGGGRFAYDAAWANDTLIGGYARGAVVPATLGAGSIGMGDWYNNAEANTANPDTDGTGWVPGYHYGATALTGQTGGTVTLTPAQAAKRVITVAGTLTSNLVLVVPAWVYSWTFVNTTGGAFTVSVKNASTAAVVIPQNGAPTPVNCDGTLVTLWSPNVAPAIFGSQPLQLGQATGRLLRVSFYSRNGSGAQTVAIDGGAATTTGAGTFTPLASTVRVRVRAQGGGGAGGGTVGTTSTTFSAAGGGAGGAYAESILMTGFSGVTVVVGVGGTGSPGASGGNGSSSQFGATTAPGGEGGAPGGLFTSTGTVRGGNGLTGSGNVLQGQGGPGGCAVIFGNTSFVSGSGGSSMFGGGANPVVSNTQVGLPALAFGAGGSGSGAQTSVSAVAGGAGASGCVVVEEYA